MHSQRPIIQQQQLQPSAQLQQPFHQQQPQLHHHPSHLLLPQPPQPHQYQPQYQPQSYQQPYQQLYQQAYPPQYLQQHVLQQPLPQPSPQPLQPLQQQQPQQIMIQASSSVEEAKRFLQSTNAWCDDDTPPQPPPRRRFTFNNHNVSPMNKFPPTREQQSVFYLNNTETKPAVNPLYPNGQHDKLKEIHELAFQSPGRVKEHAQKLNKMVSESELKPPMPANVNSPPTPVIKTIGRTKCPKEEDGDSASVQPFDPLRRKWMITTSNCDYTEMVALLKKDTTLAGLKDFTSGYTALHWAAKFGKPEIIKLIAGTHGVNVNKKSHGGYTPLHLAAIHNHEHIMELLKIYGADTSLRDHSGKLAEQYCHIRSPLRSSNENTSSASLRSKASNGSLNGSQHKHNSSSSYSHLKLSDKGRSESSSSSTSAFIRIGSLNKMRKTAAAIKGIKSWGSAESVSDSNTMPPPKSSSSSKKKRSKKTLSTPPMDKIVSGSKDSDSDSAYGF